MAICLSAACVSGRPANVVFLGAPGIGCRTGTCDTCCIPPYGTAGGSDAGSARGTPGRTRGFGGA